MKFYLLVRIGIQEKTTLIIDSRDLLPDDDDEGLPDEKTCEKVSENSLLYSSIFTSPFLLYKETLKWVHILYKLNNSKQRRFWNLPTL